MSAGNMENGESDSTEKIMEHQRREYAMLSKIAQKEREMRRMCQESAEAFHAFDDNRKDSLRGAYVDPAVNLEIGMLRQKLREKDQEIAKLKEDNQSAQFQPNSIQGKKLLDKCSHLQEENAEIARQLAEEKMQVLRIQLTAERQKRAQLRQRIAEFDKHAEQVDAENERMQKKIADLGQSLKETRTEIEKGKKDLEDYRSGKRRRSDLPEPLTPPPMPAAAAPSMLPSPVLPATTPAAPPPGADMVQAAAEAPVQFQPEKRHRKEKNKHKEKKEKIRDR